MNNKVIWITGASSGIGKSLAIKFANEDWQVAVSARRESLLKELSGRIIEVHQVCGISQLKSEFEDAYGQNNIKNE